LPVKTNDMRKSRLKSADYADARRSKPILRKSA
jgi:hypothetical protein